MTVEAKEAFLVEYNPIRQCLIREIFKSLGSEADEEMINFKGKALELNSLEPVVKLDGEG